MESKVNMKIKSNVLDVSKCESGCWKKKHQGKWFYETQ